MENTKSLNELIAVAAIVFQNEKHKKVNTVYAAEDGNVFVEENRAKLHVKSKKELQYYSITRAEAVGEEPIPSDDENEELFALKAEYLELFGKAPHHNIGLEKLKAAIDEKKAGLKNQNPE